MHYVYILKCKDDTLYTGYTNNILKRIRTHKRGKGAKYTRSRGPFKLVYLEAFNVKGDALSRERKIKDMTRPCKIKLIDELRKK